MLGRFGRGLTLLALGLTCFGQAARPTRPSAASPPGLTARLRHLLAAPQFQQGFWGVYVYSLDRRRVLFNDNGDHWFVPASNAKLFTLAAALQLLGPDFHFHTAVLAAAAPDRQGLVAGNLVLRGDGDPSFGGRPYPYRVDPPAPQLPFDPNLATRTLAAQLAGNGVRQISGDIIGDDSAFPPDPYPAGWAIGDRLWDYGAPIAALTLNDNTRFLQVNPGTTRGLPVTTQFVPGLNPPAMENLATTEAAGTGDDLHLDTDPLTGALRLQGHLALDSRDVLEALAVPDPALYAAQMLRQALLDQGITVAGAARARHVADATEGVELAARDSPPLAQILQVTAKESQNLEAELLLRQLGRVRGTAPTTAAGETVLQTFLQQAGLNANDAALVDGSGLARQDLVTPSGVVRLLAYMARQPEAAVWRGLLPVAGEDGTLEHRLRGTAVRGQIEAKTGSLSHVNALSGYASTARGEHLAFALFSNNSALPADQVRAQLDRLAAALAQ